MCITYRAALVQNWSDEKNNCQLTITTQESGARLREPGKTLVQSLLLAIGVVFISDVFIKADIAIYLNS